VDSTNLEVTNLKAKDGTAAGSIADATGVVTLNSVVATTADINGGTIDATTIGGSSPAVGNFTTVSAASAVFTTATITTVNTTTLDLTNLEVTNIKAKDGTASMTIDDLTGKVNVTTVSAASMNAAVAAITTGSVTNLTATSASVASMNAGVALLTTATVTTLNASGASIASANIGNLQFTAASIASINAGVAVINNLTATSASIASANVGVALITTGTVTALTATGASVASANVGTAVITGLTVTGASIASVNAGTATLSGNLTLNGGTANGVLYLNGSKVATSGSALTFNGTSFGVGSSNYGNAGTITAAIGVAGTTAGGLQLWSPTNGEHYVQFGDGTSAADNYRGAVGYNHTSDALLFLASSAEAMRLTSSTLYTASGINVGIGTSSPRSKLDVTGTTGITWSSGGTSSGLVTVGTQGSGGSLLVNTPSLNSSFASGLAVDGTYDSGTSKSLIRLRALGVNSGGPYTSDFAFSTTSGTTETERMRLDSSGNLGLGVTPSTSWFASSKAIQIGSAGAPYMGLVQQTTTTCDGYMLWGARLSGDRVFQYVTTGDAVAAYRQNAGTHAWFNAASGTAGNTISFTQAMTLDASGNLGVGTTSVSTGARVDIRGANNNTLSDLTAQALTVLDTTSYAQNVGGGIAFGYKYNSSGDYIARAGVIKAVKENGTDGNYATALVFATTANSASTTERVRIRSDGRVGISATNPDAKLTVRGEGTSTSTYSFEAANSSGATRFIVTDGGESSFYKSDNAVSARITSAGIFLVGKTSASQTTVGFQAEQDGIVSDGLAATANTTTTLNVYSTGAAAYRFYVGLGGTVFATNTTISAISDQRFKENVSDLDVGLDAVLALKPRKFDWKEGKGKDIKGDRGFIAQEFEQVFPDLVDEWRDPAPEGEEPYKSVRQDLIPVLVKAIQEQQAMIKSLEAKVAALESK
jgi:hypothetical protein